MKRFKGRAADLPEFSVVSFGGDAFVKAGSGDHHWRCTNEHTYSCASIDEFLASGGKVLEIGDDR